MRRIHALFAGSLLLACPSIVKAQSPCDDSEWFCDEADRAGYESDAAAPPPPVEAAPEAPPPAAGAEPAPPPGRRVTVHRPDMEPKPAKRRRYRESGINLRLEGVMMGDEQKHHQDAGMGGIGFSFRHRPVPHFAFDVGVDLVGGKDWYGRERSEAALLLSGMVFWNPRSRFQFYTIGGLGWSHADVIVVPESADVDAIHEEYGYFGGHLGFGGELRVSQRTALNLDLVGFLRTRTRAPQGAQPEFIDPETHLATNTSGGGLLRGGITFYW